VLLEVEIKSDGSIGEIKILQHPGHERLVTAAIEAIKKARIEPAVKMAGPSPRPCACHSISFLR